MSAATTSPRKTKTQPVCPSWCEISAQEHDTEAHDRIGGWYHHERRLDVGGFATLRVITTQHFEERIEGYEEQSAQGLVPAYFVEMEADALTSEQVLRLAWLMSKFVEEVNG